MEEKTCSALEATTKRRRAGPRLGDFDRFSLPHTCIVAIVFRLKFNSVYSLALQGSSEIRKYHAVVNCSKSVQGRVIHALDRISRSPLTNPTSDIIHHPRLVNLSQLHTSVVDMR